MTRSELPFDSAVATGKGDDGTTGLLFGGPRVRKDDLRTEAYGTVDETVAALGLARAELHMKKQYGVLSPNFGGLGAREAECRHGLVDRAVGLGAQVVLPDARAAEQEPCRAVVALAGGDGRVERELGAGHRVRACGCMPGVGLVAWATVTT